MLINDAGVLGSADPLSADLTLIDRDLQVDFGRCDSGHPCFPPPTRSIARLNCQHVDHGVAGKHALHGGVLGLQGGGVFDDSGASLSTRCSRRPRARRVPGAVDTDMIRHLAMPKAAPEDVAEQIITRDFVRVDRISFPDEMARQLHSVWQSDPAALAATFGNLATAA